MIPDVGLFQYFAQYGPFWVVALAMVALVARAGPSFWQRYNERLRDKLAERAGDWSRLREEIARHAAEAKETKAELTAEIRGIKDREEDCQRQLTGALHRIGELEGYNLGIGEARNTAQLMISADREAKKDKS